MGIGIDGNLGDYENDKLNLDFFNIKDYQKCIACL